MAMSQVGVLTCATVKCKAGYRCVIKRGKPRCLPPKRACNLACVKGKACIVKDGKPTCVDDYNPCAATTCPVGTDCTYEKGKAVCVQEPGYNPCAATTCLVGTSCAYQEGDEQGTCVSNCATVLCKPGLKCVIDKKGNPVCKKQGS
ncbi:hypothetical protein ABPG75_005979 [Micractinium tetrahymenae]